ncbi:hypothetical protein FOZ76_12650 [Verticiella sediminum]|uniref:DUF2497 domain-containing protein n=1 Tax=Verticiella sediminum TaxID=1247510 RepID=A0A556AMP6_9BURK|nr:hypothetical protein [Verticiella sediminum]TSH94159.1 hypothetical protein FOZ76_12650 [Verticiella sediminum]
MSYLPPFRTRRAGAAEAEAPDDEPMLLDEDDIVRDAADESAADAGTRGLAPWDEPADDDIPTLTTVVESLDAPEPSSRTQTCAPPRSQPPAAPPRAQPAAVQAAAAAPSIEDAAEDEDAFLDAAPAHATVDVPAPAPNRAGGSPLSEDAQDSVESGLSGPAVEPESAGMVVVLDDERIEQLVDEVVSALQPAVREAVRDAIRRNLLEDGPAA